MRRFLEIAWLLPILACGCAYVGGSNDANRRVALAELAILPFETPGAKQHADYLQVSATEPTFALADLDAKLLFIQVFDSCCPHCQRAISSINQLYSQIETRGLQERAKVIGVGVGNTAFVLDLFRDRYAVPFPLFPDASMAKRDALGVRGVPRMIVLRQSDRGLELVKICRSIGNSASFLDDILEHVGM
ncbi:MAG: TlpA family protein disulfide reductase [Lentisphaerae bacterium]|jgi:hypothetical protein|nr:TlpA family protein disulfide reductase [Lentisphaerota bacterium]MBT4821411.1 TlpA family protein disulfide reductase [Lentisphaerota bacterium]MBT5608343.1 TlpA family protein disulfide reductase [Lentisphaerota bacterium]MBT7061665.1 TlpA family protein disulfide reductase [Lentisphaerota bacterium]MBT7844500.1 TlpA family protein disulfide reductase [Lentisphaerota bacterium]